MTKTAVSLTRICIVFLALTMLISIPAFTQTKAWELAQQNAKIFRFSTLFTAQDMRRYLSADEGINQALGWCKETGVTHVYLETFRGGYQVPKEVMLKAKERFSKEGFAVSGCITTVGLGRKAVNGWDFPCLTEQASLDKLKSVFEYTAGLFDEIMIDDFFATKCECPDCIKAKGDKSWAEFRLNLLYDVSQKYVLEPARKINPAVKIIIKYPQWYDEFHDKGYDVDRQTTMFDKTWVGTETRDPDSQQWGKKAQYEAYFIMRWLGAIGGEKCGGGWFDPYGTAPATYLEQARQTILAGAKEAVLFCYGSLQGKEGPANVNALRSELPKLFQLAAWVNGKSIRGIHAPKPANSESDADKFIYDYIGMLGIPLAPAEKITLDAPAAFFPFHILKNPDAVSIVQKYRDSAKPVLITDTLMNKLPEAIQKNHGSIHVLEVPKDKWDIMKMEPAALNSLRNSLLKPLGVEFNAPSRTALYLFGENAIAIENFNNDAAEVELKTANIEKAKIILSTSTDVIPLNPASGKLTCKIPERTLIVIEL